MRRRRRKQAGCPPSIVMRYLGEIGLEGNCVSRTTRSLQIKRFEDELIVSIDLHFALGRRCQREERSLEEIARSTKESEEEEKVPHRSCKNINTGNQSIYPSNSIQ